MIKNLFFALSLYFFLVGMVLAQTNAGFVSGVWYSKTPFFAGETVRIYSAVQNQSGFDITGTIKFFDNGDVIGESDFSAINGRLVEKWIDWKVTEGNHKVQVKIFDAKKSIPGGGEESISLAVGSSDVDEQFADLDTDGDGVGNKEDSDDDNDGLTDNEEREQGSNPLVVNTVTEEADVEAKVASSEFPNTSTDTNTSKGKQIAEQFVVEPTKKALAESKPVIERIGELLVEKHQAIEEKIEEDRNNPNLATVGSLGFYEKIQEKLPPVFRILYGWLLKFLILVFSVWWIPLVVGILIFLRILLGVYRRLRYR
jgi:hypothetical protein